MAQYTYVYERDGRRLEGQVSAPSRKEAIQALLNLGVIPLEIKEGRQSDNKRRFKHAQLALFFKQYHLLLQKGGLSEENILSLLAEDQPPARRAALQEAVAQIRAGVPSNLALRGTGLFPDLCISMLGVGQETGKKEEVLRNLQEYYGRLAYFEKKVRGAMTYPLLTLGLAILVAFALMTYIVPQFAGLLREMNAPLPVITRVVVNLSDFMRGPLFIPLMIALGVGGVLGWRRAMAQPLFRQWYDRTILKLPVVGRVVRGLNISQVFRALHLSYQAGVPIQRAVTQAQEVATHPMYAAALSVAREQVLAGRYLSEAMAMHSELFSRVAVSLVRNGESGGSLEQMLREVASIEEEAISEIMENIGTVIEPLMIVVVGLVVGGIMLAVLLPYFTLAQSIGR